MLTANQIWNYVQSHSDLFQVNRHPVHSSLVVIKYSQEVINQQRWNEFTMACRGIVLETKTGAERIVAKGLDKFFNYDEPMGRKATFTFDENVTVFDKMDGSALLVTNDPVYGIIINTLGSFQSEMVEVAKEILTEKWGVYIAHYFECGLTYMYEIIYQLPNTSNKVVVNYFGQKFLTLLAVIDIDTGVDFNLDVLKKISAAQDISLPEVYPVSSFEEFAAQDTSNKEGAVFRDKDGNRLKVKFETYKELHRLVTNVTPRRVAEAYVAGIDVKEFLTEVDEEHDKWVEGIWKSLQAEEERIREVVDNDWNYAFTGGAALPVALTLASTRKAWAAYIKLCQFPSILFLLLDGNYDKVEVAIKRQVFSYAEKLYKQQNA